MKTLEIDVDAFGSSEELVAAVCPLRPNVCGCPACVAMCQRVPCIGTPEDMMRIALAGHLEKLHLTIWMIGVPFGIQPIRMVQIRKTEGGCPFLDGLRCSLHTPGLKPKEGALASCSGARGIEDHPATAVALTWLMARNREAVARLMWAVGHCDGRRLQAGEVVTVRAMQ